MADETSPTSPERSQASDPMARHLYCPTCGQRLFNRSCKWWCPTCGYHESCADG